MALTSFQSSILRCLAQNRRVNVGSYVAGGLALNHRLAEPRLSRDIDIFNDSVEAMLESWRIDRATLEREGYTVTPRRELRTFIEAEITRAGERTEIQWGTDSAYRFFPLVEDDVTDMRRMAADYRAVKNLTKGKTCAGNRSCTRKTFIVGTSAFAACMRLFAATGGAPNLRLGVVSDIHFLLEPKTRKLRKDWDATTFVHALKYFRERNVDAVVVAGDLAESGIVAELQFVMDAWQSVFPQDRGADGRKVERLFIYGNHDIDAPFWAGAGSAKRIAELYPDEAIRKRQIIATDRKAAWEKVFREPYAPIWTKTVKGYTFFGAHWGGDAGTPGVRDFLVREAAKLDPKKPFFFIQHPHLRGTCYGDWAGGHDDGSATRALERFPNAVAFSGHSHYALTDERSVWQGAFTSIGTGSLRYAGQPNCQFPEGFENTMSGRMMRDAETDAAKMMGLFWGNYSVRHGMVASVYDDRIVLERRDFLSDKPLGDDWIVPLPATAGGDYSFTKRRARHPAPQFAAGVVVKISDGTAKNRAGTSLSAVTVTFPPANAGKGRAYYYEVAAVDEEGGERITKRILSEGWCDPVGGPRYAKNVSCVFAKAQLPKIVRFFRVRPVGFFGAKGRAIESGG